jgi:hypothetical protein
MLMSFHYDSVMGSATNKAYKKHQQNALFCRYFRTYFEQEVRAKTLNFLLQVPSSRPIDLGFGTKKLLAIRL